MTANLRFGDNGLTLENVDVFLRKEECVCAGRVDGEPVLRLGAVTVFLSDSQLSALRATCDVVATLNADIGVTPAATEATPQSETTNGIVTQGVE